ncbi:transcription factor bHLH19-like [Bidens hawaiensis]|uniref:transcription factor bHLH19-like n=1 Tax=Bidens hawaiensis TaxID=980011 RepID=UPI004048FC28
MEEDSCFDFQWPVDSVNDHLTSMTAVEDDRHLMFGYYDPVMEPPSRPAKQLKTYTGDQSLVNWNVNYGSDCNNLSSSHSGNQNCYVFNNDFEGGSGGANVTSAKNTSSTRVAPYQDHILAERKRREKLSEKFIALSVLLPNLKKMDKATVLGDAIEYMKTLKEKVKTLEEQTSKTPNLESKRFEMSSSDEIISCFSEQYPEIKARFIGNDVLIRIHCENKPGFLEKTLAEIEKLNVTVINSNAFIFANSMLHITVTARMDKDLTMTVKDLVRNLHLGLKQFM